MKYRVETASTGARKLFLSLGLVLEMHKGLSWLSGPSMGPLQVGLSRKSLSLSPSTPKLALS